jgi:hypothetical protein
MHGWQRVAVTMVGVGVLAGTGGVANAPTGRAGGGPAGHTGAPVAAVPDAGGPDGAVVAMREIVHVQ